MSAGDTLGGKLIIQLIREVLIGMPTIAVTGANGYIGRHVVKELCDAGATVIAIDAYGERCDDRARLVAADILDDDFSVEERLGCIPDVCLHLAWRDGFNHNAPSHMEDFSGHYKFLMHMVDAGVSRIAVMGSMHEVGYWEGAIDEDTPCKPQSLYGVAKDALRRALTLELGRRGIDLQWLRGFYIYGDDELSQSIFGKLLRAAKAGEKTFPFTMGKNLYDFTPVDQLARMIAATVMQDEVLGVINCCSGKPVSLADQIESFIRDNELNIELQYGVFPDRPYDSPGVWGDATKINQIMSC